MGTPRFRVWFGTTAATLEQLARIEQIEVTQEMDAFWEAEIRMALTLDASGRWLHWPGDTSQPFSRVRVEIDIGNGAFVPLIDGPLTSIDAGLDSQPGRSTATLLVRDDSVFMHRDEETPPVWERTADGEVARAVFANFNPPITTLQIEGTATTPDSTTQRGTALSFLRGLAQANDRHVYVLPGPTPGASIGCFLPAPSGTPSLPALVMIGASRNLANASVAQDPDGAERTQAQVLRTDDQGTATFETSAEALGLLGALPAVPVDLTPRRLLHPRDNTRADPQAAAEGQARRRSYAYRLTAEVVPGRYGAVLQPYQLVRLDAGATPYSGNYLLSKVVHRITPSLYSQQIEARADSVSAVQPTEVAQALGSGLSLSFSASAGVF